MDCCFFGANEQYLDKACWFLLNQLQSQHQDKEITLKTKRLTKITLLMDQWNISDEQSSYFQVSSAQVASKCLLFLARYREDLVPVPLILVPMQHQMHSRNHVHSRIQLAKMAEKQHSPLGGVGDVFTGNVSPMNFSSLSE